MYRDNFINSLRTELVEMVADHLTPVALRYGYSEVPLETNIKWRPQVLVLGNYSSGKSTLINEFLGAKIQVTGQAPTDDSFTIITYDDSVPEGSPIRVTEERDGKFLLNDPEYPFESLKKHGQRFAAHFRLKKVNSPFLKNLAIIDTPGMLDSMSERDRGYNYQEVIGDFAQLADLVLVLFDPHKAGTVREAHTSLRETLPARTFEDRVLFVLNRIDECASMIDLLRVYGTLCWNLSQITGRKDIPMVHLTYSPRAAAGSTFKDDNDSGYLRYLENQREELKKAILEAPRFRLDHLASFVETHSERLSHFLEALISYRRKLNKFRIRNGLIGMIISLLCGGAAALIAGMWAGLLGIAGAGGIVTLSVLTLWLTVIMKLMTSSFHRNHLESIDELTSLNTQTRQDSWRAVRDLTRKYLKNTLGKFPLKDATRDYNDILRIRDEGSREIREALNELSTIRHADSGNAHPPEAELPGSERS